MFTRSSKSKGEVCLDDSYRDIFRPTAGRRHARTLVHKARWRFRLVRNARPGPHEAENGGHLLVWTAPDGIKRARMRSL